jgi:hypothetical protein
MENLSLDDQLNSLEKSITGSISSTSGSLSVSAGSGSKHWSSYIRFAVCAALSGALLAVFRPIWIYRLQYIDDDSAPQKKVLWMKALGAWAGIAIVMFAAYHFVISKYVVY